MADFSAKHYQIKSEKNMIRAGEEADRAKSYADSIEPETFVKTSGDQTVGGVKTLTSSPILNAATANMVAIVNANKQLTSSSGITTTELNYLDGVTSNIQNQLNGKASTANAVTASGSNYIKFGNGIIIQWGTSTSIDASQAITLPVPMTTASYAIIPQYAAGSASANSGSVVTARTTTSFTVYWGAGSGSRAQSFLSWIVVGK